MSAESDDASLAALHEALRASQEDLRRMEARCVELLARITADYRAERWAAAVGLPVVVWTGRRAGLSFDTRDPAEWVIVRQTASSIWARPRYAKEACRFNARSRREFGGKAWIILTDRVAEATPCPAEYLALPLTEAERIDADIEDDR